MTSAEETSAPAIILASSPADRRHSSVIDRPVQWPGHLSARAATLPRSDEVAKEPYHTDR
jgi:hypothetical protein